MTERDPATNPLHDLRRHPQDPDARQPGERLRDFWARVGERRDSPPQPGDELEPV